jgi:hypothetical protein
MDLRLGQNVQWKLLTAVELGHIFKDTMRLREFSGYLHDPHVLRDAFACAGDGTLNPAKTMHAIRALRQLIWLQTERVVGCLLEGRPLRKELDATAACSLRKDVATWYAGAWNLKDSGTWAGQPPKVCVVNEDILQVAQGLARTCSKVAVLN